jgi:flagellar motor switch protein FliM
VPDAWYVGYSDQANAGAGVRRRRGEARTYDFRRPVRLAREHAHLLRMAMTTFGRQSTTVLTTSLRVVCSLSTPVIEELSYDEFLTGIPDQSLCAVVSLEPWNGRALLTFDTSILLSMVDHQLGGPGGDSQPDRPLTDIEQAIFRQLLARMLRARMDLTVGSRTSAAALCLPYAMLAPALQQMNQSTDGGERARARVDAAQLTQQRLSDVEVDVAVRFESLRMASAAIGRLAVGDVIPLGHRTTAPLSVTSASTTFARAVPGSSGRKLAVLIVPPS